MATRNSRLVINRQQAAGDQAGAAFTAPQKRTQLGRIPHIVDDDQTGFLLKLFGQGDGGIFRVFEGGAITGELRVELGQGVGDGRAFPQGGPENAVFKRLDHLLVVAEGKGEGGLAEAACTGDRQRIAALLIQQKGAQGLEFPRPLHKVLRQILCHEGGPFFKLDAL